MKITNGILGNKGNLGCLCGGFCMKSAFTKVSKNLNCFSNLARYGNGVDISIYCVITGWNIAICAHYGISGLKYGARLVSHLDGKPKCIVFASERGEEEWMEN